jgi:hypothetical protein
MFYVCEVRENKDPSGSGRVKVRFYNKENDEQNIPDDGLSWAHPLYPISAIPNAGIGSSFPAPMVGSRLLCIFLPDDDGKQSPFYIGGIARSESAGVKGIQQKDPKNGAKKPSSLKAPDQAGDRK